MVIRYICIQIQKGSEGMLRMQQAGAQNRQIGRSRKQSRSTDSCAIHGFLRKVWIHRLRSAIHGLRRSTDCAQHRHGRSGLQRRYYRPIYTKLSAIGSVCSASDFPTNVAFREICRILSNFVYIGRILDVMTK